MQTHIIYAYQCQNSTDMHILVYGDENKGMIVRYTEDDKERLSTCEYFFFLNIRFQDTSELEIYNIALAKANV